MLIPSSCSTTNTRWHVVLSPLARQRRRCMQAHGIQEEETPQGRGKPWFFYLSRQVINLVAKRDKHNHRLVENLFGASAHRRGRASLALSFMQMISSPRTSASKQARSAHAPK